VVGVKGIGSWATWGVVGAERLVVVAVAVGFKVESDIGCEEGTERGCSVWTGETGGGVIDTGEVDGATRGGSVEIDGVGAWGAEAGVMETIGAFGEAVVSSILALDTA